MRKKMTAAPRRLFRDGPARRDTTMSPSNAPVCAICGKKGSAKQPGWEVFQVLKGPHRGSMVGHCPACQGARPDLVMKSTFRAVGMPMPAGRETPIVRIDDAEGGYIAMLRADVEAFTLSCAIETGMEIEEARESANRLIEMGAVRLVDDLATLRALAVREDSDGA